MKTALLAAVLCLLTLTTYAQDWPRNLKTGKVEFTGALPWPATAKTEAQRRALVKRWYLAKLTDSTPAEVKAQASTNKTNGLLTYAGLPKVAVLQAGKGDTAQFLAYMVSIVTSSKGAKIKFSGFGINERSKDSTPLESHLTASTKNEQAALAVLRKRLAVAVKGWN
jgi:hypothetical protein